MERSIGATPLHNAAWNGHVEVVHALIEAGANKDAKNKDGATPLNSAAKKGHVDVVRALIEAGADKEAKDSWGETPLHDAARNGPVAVLLVLLAEGADKDAKSKEGATPLYIAAQKGHVDVVNALIKAGANKKAKTNSGQTPIDIAKQNSRTDVVAALTDAKTNNAWSPLYSAAATGHVGIVNTLLTTEANVDIPALLEVFICLRKAVTEASEDAQQSVADTLRHLFIALKEYPSQLDTFFTSLEDLFKTTASNEQIYLSATLETVMETLEVNQRIAFIDMISHYNACWQVVEGICCEQLNAIIMHRTMDVDISSTAFLNLSKHHDNPVAIYIAGILGEYIYHNPSHATKAHLLQLITHYGSHEMQHAVFKGIIMCLVLGYDALLGATLHMPDDNTLLYHFFYVHKAEPYDFVLEKLRSERKDKQLVTCVLGRKKEKVFSGDEADRLTKAVKLLKFSKVLSEEAKKEVTDEPKTHEETLSNETILSAGSLLEKASKILVESIPPIEDKDRFLAFYTNINSMFDTVFVDALKESFFIEAARKSFETLYIKLLNFEAMHSTTLEALSKKLILQFLSHGFATSFDLRSHTLSFKGASYKICDNTAILQEFAKEAVRGSEDHNLLAHQYSTYNPLFPNTESGLPCAVVDIDPMQCLGLLSKKSLDMYTCDMSLLVRINQATEDMYVKSALLLEYRDVNGYYNYAKIMHSPHSPQGRVEIDKDFYRPDDVHNHLTTIFNEMRYVESDFNPQRPMYYTLTKRGDSAFVDKLLTLANESVQDGFTFFAGQYGLSVEAPFTLKMLKEMPIAHWNKKDLLQLERNKDSEDTYYHYEVTLQTRLFMDTGYAASEVARLNALIHKTQSNFAALNSSAALSDARMQKLQAMQDNIGGLKADLEGKLETLTSQQEGDRSATAAQIANIQSDLSNAIVSADFYNSLMQKADVLDKVLNTQAQSDDKDFEVEAICADPYKKSFYDTLRTKLSQAYLAASVIVTEFVRNNKKEAKGYIGAFLEDVSAYIPLVGVGIGALGKVLQYADERIQLKMLENYTFFAVDSIELSEILERIARRLIQYNLRCDAVDRETTLQKVTRILKKGATKAIESSDNLIVHGSIIGSTPPSTIPPEVMTDMDKGAEDADKVVSIITASVFAGALRYKTKEDKVETVIQGVRAHFGSDSNPTIPTRSADTVPSALSYTPTSEIQALKNQIATLRAELVQVVEQSVDRQQVQVDDLSRTLQDVSKRCDQLESQADGDNTVVMETVATLKNELTTIANRVEPMTEAHQFIQNLRQHSDVLTTLINRQIGDAAAHGRIREIEANPYLKSFYYKLRRKLNAGYLAATAIISGWVKNRKTGKLGSIGSFAKSVSSAVPLFGLGVKALGSVLRMADKKQQKKLLTSYANFAVDSTEMNAFSEAVSREVIYLDNVDYEKSPTMLRRMLGAAERTATSGSLGAASASEVEEIVLDALESEVQDGAAAPATQARVSDEDETEQEQLGEKHASKVFDVIAASIFSSSEISALGSEGKHAHIISNVRTHFTV